MDPLTIGLMAASLGMSVYGNIKAAKDKEEAAQKQAFLDEQQANEILARQAANEAIMQDQAAYNESHYVAAMGGTGVLDTGIGGAIAIHTNLSRAIAAARHEAAYTSNMIRMGAQINTEIASNQVTAAYIRSGGQVLGAAGEVYLRHRKPTSTVKDLPTD